MARPICQRERLSDRECEVLCWVMEGFSNAEIARQLTVSSETVKSHLSHCLSKLGGPWSHPSRGAGSAQRPAAAAALTIPAAQGPVGASGQCPE